MAMVNTRINGELLRRLEQAVEDGLYESKSEAVRSALRAELPDLPDEYERYDDY